MATLCSLCRRVSGSSNFRCFGQRKFKFLLCLGASEFQSSWMDVSSNLKMMRTLSLHMSLHSGFLVLLWILPLRNHSSSDLSTSCIFAFRVPSPHTCGWSLHCWLQEIGVVFHISKRRHLVRWWSHLPLLVLSWTIHLYEASINFPIPACVYPKQIVNLAMKSYIYIVCENTNFLGKNYLLDKTSHQIDGLCHYLN